MTAHFIKQKDFSSKFQRFKGRAPASGVGFLVDAFMLTDKAHTGGPLIRPCLKFPYHPLVLHTGDQTLKTCICEGQTTATGSLAWPGCSVP